MNAKQIGSGIGAPLVAWVAMMIAGVCGSVAVAQRHEPMPGGELKILTPDGRQVGVCPLQHTDVEATIAAYVSRTRVRQTFRNPLDTKIEAVYVFPLPDNAAVDAMVMTVGDRRIVGEIQTRDQARQTYIAARQAGHVAALLDQERPNIFTQSVANIEPGATVVIEISYVETLTYADGFYEFVFPMVVGPRYIPGGGSAPGPMTTGTPTTQVPDADRITPPVTPEGTRAGHGISLTVHIDAGMPVYDVASTLHTIEIDNTAARGCTVTLASRKTIPNRDFVLRYRTATDQISDAALWHTDERGTFLTLVLQPPQRVRPADAMPKEMIFVIDRSGSMSGFPIEKAKETMRLCIEMMNPSDTFNLLSFSGGTGRCFDTPVPNTAQNRTMALKYLADLYGSGGTEMMKAIRATLEGQNDPDRLRIVCFMTDGYIGNDFELIDAVKRNAGTARVFAFGIGNSVNRFLLDGMAHAGRGEVEYVTLASQGDAAAQRFAQRINAPVLTDIDIDWDGLAVDDVYPANIPDMFSVKPIMIHARLTKPVATTITLRGQTGAGPFERRIDLTPPQQGGQHDALPSLWARAKVSHLMHQDLAAMQRGTLPEELTGQITQLGLDYRLMTQFTSFVAVEELTVTAGGEPTTVRVPVEMPDGVSYEGVFGVNAERLAGAGGLRTRGAAQLSKMSLGALVAPSPTASPMVQGQMVRESSDSRSNHVSALVDAAPTDGDNKPAKPDVNTKLAAALRDLADKVARKGKNGNLTVGKLKVIDYNVDIMVQLRDLSDDTRRALKAMGFTETAQSHTARVLIGTIDVRQLKALAALDAVLSVTPVAAP